MLGEVNSSEASCPANVLGDWLSSALPDLKPVRPHQRAVVSDDAFQSFEGQVQAIERSVSPLQPLYDGYRLGVVIEPASVSENLVQVMLSAMSEGRMPQVMTEGYVFRQLRIEIEACSDSTCDLRDLQRVRQSGAHMIAREREYLCLQAQSAEGGGVDNSLAVASEFRPPIRARPLEEPSTGWDRVCSDRRTHQNAGA